MAIRTAIWKIAEKPTQLLESSLSSEKLLEDLIVAAPEILSSDWMLIGRQEDTGAGGRIDLLAMAPDGSLALIELKRERTPREVVAQAIDYASWVENLKPEDIADIYGRYRPGMDLGDAFAERFGRSLDEDAINSSHEIVVVASSIDASTERIVGYLRERGIAINVLCFQVFSHQKEQLIARSWLVDPTKTPVENTKGENREPWNGEFYSSYGDGESRSWEEAVKYGFICGGGGSWYSSTLQLLSPGDRVWVNVPGKGYVGVCEVAGSATPAIDFKIEEDGVARPALEVLSRAKYHREYASDPEKSEYFVPVRWIETRPIALAVREIGLFGSQHTVCRPTTQKWRHTVERLKSYFKISSGPK